MYLLYALSITTTTTNLSNGCMFVGYVDFDLLLDVVSCLAVVDLSNSCNDSNKYNSDNRNTTPDQCSICSLQFYLWLKTQAVYRRISRSETCHSARTEKNFDDDDNRRRRRHALDITYTTSTATRDNNKQVLLLWLLLDCLFGC